MTEAIAASLPPSGRAAETARVAETETRAALAAAFRVASHLGWNKEMGNHITARLPHAPDRFLMNPYGLGWHEMTTSSLVVVGPDGRPVDDPGAPMSPAGVNFHSGIYRARPEINSIIHVHAVAGVVISALADGLTILDQAGCYLLGEVGHHDFEGFVQEEDEVPRILADLGPRHCLILRNHGLLSVGGSVGEAFSFMGRLITACELQERVLATGARINHIPQPILDVTERQIAGKARRRIAAEWQMYLRWAERLDPSYRS